MMQFFKNKCILKGLLNEKELYNFESKIKWVEVQKHKDGNSQNTKYFSLQWFAAMPCKAFFS